MEVFRRESAILSASQQLRYSFKAESFHFHSALNRLSPSSQRLGCLLFFLGKMIRTPFENQLKCSYEEVSKNFALLCNFTGINCLLKFGLYPSDIDSIRPWLGIDYSSKGQALVM